MFFGTRRLYPAEYALPIDTPVFATSVVKVPAAGVVEPMAGGLANMLVELHVVPLLANTFPDAPGATTCTADVPFPRMTLFAVSVVAPVPPYATGSAVPL
jgi:hypothetical protein